MQTEWSPGNSDEHGRVNDTPTEPEESRPGGGTTDIDSGSDDGGTTDITSAVADTGWGVAVTDVATGSTADSETTAPDAGQEGEEEAHRSAVDAVDELLDEVELALARLDDGTYGRCETCGSPIDDAELAALPLVRSCRTCESGALALEGV